jgi:TatA/E family protein of Tat protein translocase
MSGSHMLILAVIVVVFVMGPAKLPQLGRSLGDAIRGFKKGMAGEEEGEIDVTNSAKEKLHGDMSRESQSQKQTTKEKV